MRRFFCHHDQDSLHFGPALNLMHLGTTVNQQVYIVSSKFDKGTKELSPHQSDHRVFRSEM
jgi:hypothetical protein